MVVSTKEKRKRKKNSISHRIYYSNNPRPPPRSSLELHFHPQQHLRPSSAMKKGKKKLGYVRKKEMTI